MARTRQDDFILQNHGSICILQARSRRAKNWVEDFILQNEETQYFNGGIVIEPRYVGPIVDGIFGDGLTVAGVL